MKDCIFCKIIDNEISSYTIYEDEIVKVFLDIDQSSQGHMLVIPKEHTLDMTTISDETLMHIKKIALKMKDLLTDKSHADGITFIQNNGYAQEVKHFHLHVIPKYINEKEERSIEEIFNELRK